MKACFQPFLQPYSYRRDMPAVLRPASSQRCTLPSAIRRVISPSRQFASTTRHFIFATRRDIFVNRRVVFQNPYILAASRHTPFPIWETAGKRGRDRFICNYFAMANNSTIFFSNRPSVNSCLNFALPFLPMIVISSWLSIKCAILSASDTASFFLTI